MIHTEATNGDIGFVKVKGSTSELVTEFASVVHTLFESLAEEYGKETARGLLRAVFKLVLDDEKMQEVFVPDKGFDGGVQ